MRTGLRLDGLRHDSLPVSLPRGLPAEGVPQGSDRGQREAGAILERANPRVHASWQRTLAESIPGAYVPIPVGISGP